MPSLKQLRQQTVETSTSPPDALTKTQHLAYIVKATGHNIYEVALPSKEHVLAELPAKFRNLVWMRRGGFVVVDTEGEGLAQGRDNKLFGEITHIVTDEKAWRKMSYWPKEFKNRWEEEDDEESEEESRVGKMPSDSDDSD